MCYYCTATFTSTAFNAINAYTTITSITTTTFKVNKQPESYFENK